MNAKLEMLKSHLENNRYAAEKEVHSIVDSNGEMPEDSYEAKELGYWTDRSTFCYGLLKLIDCLDSVTDEEASIFMIGFLNGSSGRDIDDAIANLSGELEKWRTDEKGRHWIK